MKTKEKAPKPAAKSKTPAAKTVKKKKLNPMELAEKYIPDGMFSFLQDILEPHEKRENHGKK